MTDPELPGLEPVPASEGPSDATGESAAHQRQRRMIAIGAIAAGAVALVIVLVVALGGGDDKLSAQGDSTSSSAAPTTSSTSTAPPTTRAVATTDEPETTEAPETTTAATTTTIVAETTTSVIDTTTTTVVETTTTTVPVTAAPQTAPPVTAPPSDDPAANCSIVGSLSVPSIGTEAKILKEAKQYKDGLLCGNHKADKIEEGVDILPGFASFEDSLAGGDALIGKIPAIIFGHRNSHNRPFLRINTMQAGDVATITYLDGSTITLQLVNLELLPLKQATAELLAPSVDGVAELRFVACSHADGTPGGINYRWVATMVRV